MPTFAPTAGRVRRAPWEAAPFDDIAVSDEVRSLGEHLRKNLAAAAAQRAHAAEIDAGLTGLLVSSSDTNWDGYGAQRVQDVSIGNAGLLLALLPDYPSPDFAVDPQGRVALDWCRGPNQVLSVLVGGAEAPPYLVYAAMFESGATSRGREPFAGRDVPSEVAGALARLYGDAPRLG
jgi:hypothetical protein